MSRDTKCWYFATLLKIKCKALPVISHMGKNYGIVPSFLPCFTQDESSRLWKDTTSITRGGALHWTRDLRQISLVQILNLIFRLVFIIISQNWWIFTVTSAPENIKLFYMNYRSCGKVSLISIKKNMLQSRTLLKNLLNNCFFKSFIFNFNVCA